MKHTKQSLIQAAQEKSADRGEAWKRRMEAWLKLHINPIPEYDNGDGTHYMIWEPRPFTCYSDPEFVGAFLENNPFFKKVE